MNSYAIWLSILFCVVFGLVSLILPADPLLEIISAGIFVAAVIGIWRWGPAAFRVYFPRKDKPKPDRETSLGLLGLVLWLFSEAGKRVYAVYYIQLDRPEWMQVLHISAGLNAITLIGLVLVIAATRWPGEKPSKLPGAMASIVAFFGVLLSAALPYFAAKFTILMEVIGRVGAFLLPH